MPIHLTTAKCVANSVDRDHMPHSAASDMSTVSYITGPIFLKNRHFIIQERFNKLKYVKNTIIKCGT